MRITALHRRIRLAACVTILGATVAACSDSSAGPKGGQWWEGTWSAVRANNAPLPFRSDRGVVVRDLIATLHSDTTQASTFYSAGTITTLQGQVVDNTSSRTVKVTPSNETVSIFAGPTSTIGQLQITFTRKADTLVLANYSGAEFKLIRR